MKMTLNAPQLRTDQRLMAAALLAVLLLSGCQHVQPTTQQQPAMCETTLGSPIPRFCEVHADTLWRGSKPTTTEAAWLVQHGVKSVVNLELLHDDRAQFAQAQLSEPQQAQIDYFKLYDWEIFPVVAPAQTDQRIVQFLAIMQQQAKPVYVHCRSGQNRTGLMVAAYRIMVQDWPIEQAIEEMRGFDGLWFNSHAAYLRSLNPAKQQHLLAQAQQLRTTQQRRAQIVCAAQRCRVQP